MRGLRSTSYLFVLWFCLLVQGQEEDDDGLGKTPPTAVSGRPTPLQRFRLSRSTTSSTVVSTTSSSDAATKSPLQTSSISVTSARAIDTPTLASPPSNTFTPSPFASVATDGAVSSNSISPPHRTLVIVLSVVLGSIGLLLVALVLFLMSRYRKRRSSRRGVSPINDEEIESWRNKERKQPLGSPSGGIEASSFAPSAVRSADWPRSPSNIVSQPSPAHTRGPSLVAKAPNARIGLTTEVVPGAEPFVPPIKRQTSRLSKSPRGHTRTKSMRSSTSAKSIRSMNEGSVGVIDFTMSPEGVPHWYNSENRPTGSHTFVNTEVSASSPGTSIYDVSYEAGGLSPRPRQSQRQWEKSTQTSANQPPGWPISWN